MGLPCGTTGSHLPQPFIRIRSPFPMDLRIFRRLRPRLSLSLFAMLVAGPLFAACVLFIGCDRPPAETDGEATHTAISSDSVSIAYQVAGDRQAPTILFIHGWMCDRTYWDQQIDYFSRDYQVVAVDLAGHGDSGTGREEWTLEAFAEDVVAVVEALGAKRLVLVGHSLGGPVAVEAAGRLSGRVEGVVGVDTFFDTWAQKTAEEGHSNLLQALGKDFREATVDWVSAAMFLPRTDSAFVHRIARDMASGPKKVGIGAMEGVDAWLVDNFPERLSAMDVPVGMIVSELNSQAFSVVDSVGTARGPLRIRLLPGTGHFLMQERPEAFNQALEALVADWTEGSGPAS